jgi:dihydropteroate synthase
MGNHRQRPARRHHGRQRAASAQRLDAAHAPSRAVRPQRRCRLPWRQSQRPPPPECLFTTRTGLAAPFFYVSPEPMLWQTTRFSIDLSRPRPWALSMSRRFLFRRRTACSTASALAHCEQLLKDGADILDIGGESTRPGSAGCAAGRGTGACAAGGARCRGLGVPVSVDTYKPEVMQAVLDLGADIINDVWALRQPGCAQVVARAPNVRCVPDAHARRSADHAAAPMQGDVLPQVLSFLELSRASHASARGRKDTHVVDPALVLAKPCAKFHAAGAPGELLALGYPVLAGLVAQVMVAWVRSLAVDVGERLVPSVAAALLAVERGARIVRVHDVRENSQSAAASRCWGRTKFGEISTRT